MNVSVNDWEAYGFDQVWHQSSTQAQIFEQVEALALSVADGYNACICCYGQTGSGKTFTSRLIAWITKDTDQFLA